MGLFTSLGAVEVELHRLAGGGARDGDVDDRLAERALHLELPGLATSAIGDIQRRGALEIVDRGVGQVGRHRLAAVANAVDDLRDEIPALPWGELDAIGPGGDRRLQELFGQQMDVEERLLLRRHREWRLALEIDELRFARRRVLLAAREALLEGLAGEVEALLLRNRCVAVLPVRQDRSDEDHDRHRPSDPEDRDGQRSDQRQRASPDVQQVPLQVVEVEVASVRLQAARDQPPPRKEDDREQHRLEPVDERRGLGRKKEDRMIEHRR
jgi:hypothetical protein